MNTNSFWVGFFTAIFIVAIILAANGHFANSPIYFGLW